jgi:membrane associated rhomboid family serine protease
MEKAIGTVRFVIVYFPSGIMGFILGANFAGNGIASTGCSGSLFGIIALVLLVISLLTRLTGRISVTIGIPMNIQNDNWQFY